MTRSATLERDVLNPAARLGLTARAFVYLLIGVLAILVAAGHSTAETDQWGAMQQLNRGTAGHVLLWVVALGLAGYSLWRFSEAAFGVAGDGRKAGPRLKSFARGCIYGVLAFTAFQIAAGGTSHSQAGRQVNLTAKVMSHSGGRVVVGLVGAAVAVVGATLVVEGVTPQVREVPRPLADVSGRSAARGGRRRGRHGGPGSRVRAGWGVRDPGGVGLPAEQGGRTGRRVAFVA